MTFRQRVGATAMALGGALALTLVAGGSALAAITSTNTTNDATNVTYVYQYSAVGSWYRAYIDTDRNSATGFATAGIGANFMLENGSLYRHVGPGWSEPTSTSGAVAAGRRRHRPVPSSRSTRTPPIRRGPRWSPPRTATPLSL